MEEFFDVLNENGEYTNETASREECHKKGLYHKAVVVIILSTDNKKASCTVVVKPIIPTEMKLNKSSLKLKVNSSERIIATMSPDNTRDDRIQCISEDMDIAVADYDCNITGL